MASPTGSGPRKQRTRQHVIADQSANYVERFVLAEGHTAQRQAHDYGYDLWVITYDPNGYVEPGAISVQLKASDGLRLSGAEFEYDLDVRDYRLWTMELQPVVLILYDAIRQRAYWLHVQRYFHADPARRPRKGAKTVRVRVPARRFNRRAVVALRRIKNDLLDRITKAVARD